MDEERKTGTHGGVIPTSPLPYCRLYRSGLEHINDLTSMELDVLLQCLSVVEWNTNRVFFNPYNRKNMARAIGITEESTRVAMVGMGKKNFVYKIQRQLYYLNPTIAFYGTDAAREELLEIGIEWKIKKLFKK